MPRLRIQAGAEEKIQAEKTYHIKILFGVARCGEYGLNGCIRIFVCL